MRSLPLVRRAAAVALAVTITAVGFVGTTSAGATRIIGTLSVFAGTGNQGTPTTGPATSSDFDAPQSTATDSLGNVYLTDDNACQVFKVAADGTMSVFAGTGTCGTPTPGPATSSDLTGPSGIVIDSADNVFLAEYQNNQIIKVTAGGTLSIFSNLSGWALAIDSSDNLYVTDTNAYVIRKITSDGTPSIIAGTGSYGWETPGPATSSLLGFPTGVTVDSTGNVYFSDPNSNKVYKIATDGTLSDFAGNGGSGSLTPGPATNSELNIPNGLGIDSSDNVYIAVSGNSRVVKVTPEGTLSIVAGNGGNGSVTPGPATSTYLDSPVDVKVDSSGNVYITDFRNKQFLKVVFAAAPVSAPDAPVRVSSVAGDRQATNSFATPYDGGSAITGYDVKVNSSSWRSVSCNENAGTTSCTVTGLTNYTSPAVSVRAVNAIGSSAGSNQIWVRPRLTGPTLSKASANSSSAIHVTFTGVTIPSSTSKGYTAYAYYSGTDFAASSCTTRPNERACDIKGLNAGTRYDIVVINYFRFTATPDIPRETLPSNTRSVTTRN